MNVGKVCRESTVCRERAIQIKCYVYLDAHREHSKERAIYIGSNVKARAVFKRASFNG